MRMAPAVVLSPDERAILATWARGRSFPLRLMQRARIVTMAGDGVLNQDIAWEVGVSRPTVQLWRERFLALRLAGLQHDAPRPGRLPSITDAHVRARRAGGAPEAAGPLLRGRDMHSAAISMCAPTAPGEAWRANDSTAGGISTGIRFETAVAPFPA